MENGDKRAFRRTEGVLYFACRRRRAPAITYADPNEIKSYKLLKVMLQNLNSYLEYRNPPDIDIYKQFIRILEELDREIEGHEDPKHETPVYHKQPAIVSGESFEFATFQPHAIGEEIELSLYFPIYPFSAVTVLTRVMKIKPHSGVFGDKRVVLRYLDISMVDQEEIIKYVATRERERIRQKRLSDW